MHLTKFGTISANQKFRDCDSLPSGSFEVLKANLKSI